MLNSAQLAWLGTNWLEAFAYNWATVPHWVQTLPSVVFVQMDITTTWITKMGNQLVWCAHHAWRTVWNAAVQKPARLAIQDPIGQSKRPLGNAHPAQPCVQIALGLTHAALVLLVHTEWPPTLPQHVVPAQPDALNAPGPPLAPNVKLDSNCYHYNPYSGLVS